MPCAARRAEDTAPGPSAGQKSAVPWSARPTLLGAPPGTELALAFHGMRTLFGADKEESGVAVASFGVCRAHRKETLVATWPQCRAFQLFRAAPRQLGPQVWLGPCLSLGTGFPHSVLPVRTGHRVKER